ncbi:hypothetical protein ACNI3T_10955, partial [Christiangramia sp. ASW11-125]|uniref:hypothetical protein n=1 Tax=Christiangramia sp. ASW11-125 TaxID=3400701 RepID=UPI003AACEEEE
LDLRVDKIIKSQSHLQQTNFAYNHISQLFNESTFIPFSSWAISPNAILHILNDIVINRRKAIIEFGAGSSTFYIAKLIDSLQLETTFYSIESDPEWSKELVRQLKILKLDHCVTIITTPIVEAPSNLSLKGQKTWYDIEIINSYLEKEIKFDLVIVDGPVGASTPFSRYSAIPFLKNSLKSHFSVFLDDVNRNDEKVIIEEWNNILGCHIFYYDRYAYLTNNDNFDTLPFQINS